MPRQQSARDDGFSLTELVVAALLIQVVILAIVTLATPVGNAAYAQPEAIDAAQRLRFAAASIVRDVLAAGAGLDSGPRRGPLGAYFAPILPRRIGALAPDAPTTARRDAITLVWVPATATQTTVVAPFSLSSLAVRDAPGCPIGRPLCGITAGMGVLMFDRSGSFDLFSVESVSDTGASLRHRSTSGPYLYGDGASVAEVEARTYYFDAARRQLRRYDTDLTDIPVLDDVVGLTLEYFGRAMPPVLPRPPEGEANCLFDAGGSARPGMVTLPVDDSELAPLPLALFTDGPWCGAGNTAYDVDLLRVRRVRVTLRVQAASSGLRATGNRFRVGGSSRSAWRDVGDIVAAFDVAPRNLALWD